MTEKRKREVTLGWALGHGYMEACPVLLGEVCEGSAFHNPSQIQLAGNVFKPITSDQRRRAR